MLYSKIMGLVNLIKVYSDPKLACALLLLQFEVVAAEPIAISSPDNSLKVEFLLENGAPKYRLFRTGEQIISKSSLGFLFKQQPSLNSNFSLLQASERTVRENWERSWGQSKRVENYYNELTIQLKEKSAKPRLLTIIFRVFDDGIGFRYSLPKQQFLNQFQITAEQTEFTLSGEHTAWWTPADYDSYEALYRETPLAEVKAVNTPITLQKHESLFLSIHEAALTDYAGMTLIKENVGASPASTLSSDLVPWPDGIKVKAKTPFKTPWRTIQVAKSAADLITSDLIENLNDPSVIGDTSWIKPMKYIGIWWGMHMRKYTWEAGPKHGATTRNTKDYIDFAAENNIGGVLVEGWNRGWETWHTGNNVQDFTQAYDDFDLAEVVRYAKSKNVSFIGHHETGGNIPLYEQQMELAFALYGKLGVAAVKTGYAGKMLPVGTYHHGQLMVNHYRRVVQLAAKHKIMLNAHEPIKATGIRRTYPNMMTREGGRGMEWNGWSEGNSPEHTLMLPFTRLLAGPMDYTPGIFNIKFDPQQQYRVHTTLAKQLAMFVTLYSPMQMAADMIQNYQQQPAFEFINKVPADWDETQILAAEIGNFISIARRNGNSWFIGSMTDEQPRNLSFKLDFLDENTSYKARIFSDSKDTRFYENPTAIDITSYKVNKGDELLIAMASGGGQAIYLEPVSKEFAAKLTPIDEFNRQSKENVSVFANGRRFGEVKQTKHLALNKPVQYYSQFDQGYAAGGVQALVDGKIGGADYKSLWQGYRKKDLDVVIDLGEETPVSLIEVGFLQSQLHSILLPEKVTFSLSLDNSNYTVAGIEPYHTTKDIPDYQQKRFSTKLSNQKARYIRVQATNLSKLPNWHIRPGQETFIFADEIVVR